MKPLRYYVAISIDGFIADPEGGFDAFTSDPDYVREFFDSLAQFDTVVMGRKTYEVGLRYQQTNPYPQLRTFVFSRTMSRSPDEAVTLVSSDVEQHVRDLKSEPGTAIWLCGGGNLAAQLLRVGLIDEVILKVNPLMLGDGIRLFGDVVPTTQLIVAAAAVVRESSSGGARCFSGYQPHVWPSFCFFRWAMSGA